MAMRSTLVNKVVAFKLYSNKSLSDPDSDDSGSEGFSTYNAAPKPNTMEVHISGALAAYTKA